jgi:hypothetical protein
MSRDSQQSDTCRFFRVRVRVRVKKTCAGSRKTERLQDGWGAVAKMQD